MEIRIYMTHTGKKANISKNSNKAFRVVKYRFLELKDKIFLVELNRNMCFLLHINLSKTTEFESTELLPLDQVKRFFTQKEMGNMANVLGICKQDADIHRNEAPEIQLSH